MRTTLLLLICPLLATAASPGRWSPTQHLSPGAVGQRLVLVPDLDGDGVKDFAMTQVPDRGLSTQKISIYSSRTKKLIRDILSPSDAKSFGAALSAIPDLDGDGVDDLVISAEVAGRCSPAAAMMIHSGATGALLRRIDSEGTIAFSADFVLVVPDMDGDGREDVAISYINYPNCDVYNQVPGVKIYSSATGKALATIDTKRIFRLPDLNGDGIDEIAVDQQPGYGSARQLELRSGANREPFRRYNVLFEPTSIATADVDGDGKLELIVGDSLAGIAGTFPGTVYILSNMGGALFHQIDGRTDYGMFGSKVLNAGDLDGDRKDDILVLDNGDRTIHAFSGLTGKNLYSIDPPASSGGYFKLWGPVDDLDKDGRPDIAASLVGGHSTDRGTVFFFSGANGKILHQIAGSVNDQQFGSGLVFLEKPRSDSPSEFVIIRTVSPEISVYTFDR